MRIPNSAVSRTQLQFNITPLIDVVFLLIIFFLVASHFVRNEAAEHVELPVAGRASPDTTVASGRLTVTILQNGDLSVAGQPVDDQFIRDRIIELAASSDTHASPVEVRIRADRAVRFAAVRRILGQCAAQGISNIQFAVLDADSNP